MLLTSLNGLSSPSSLAERYRKGDAGVVSLFGRHPSHTQDWIARAEELDRSESGRIDRRRLAAALRSYQSQLTPSVAVDRHIDALESEGALTVVGGQQAGLFGGAMLIVHKAMTVIQAARHAQKLLGRPVVPVFWIAGEDHDYDEANHVFVASTEGQVKRVKLDRPEGPRHSVSRTALSADRWTDAIEQLSAALPDTEYKNGLLEQFRRHAADAPTLSLAFARLLSDWFGADGLVLLDADDPALRALEAPFFRRLIERSGELSAALLEGEARVRALELPLQAESAPDGANLFVHGETGRLLLFKRDDRFADRKDEVAFTQAELLRLADESPDRLSNNALSRPLMQDYALPVLGTVLGPSEIAYWGTLGPAFACFGMTMPLLLPRQSFTYLEPTVEKLLAKYGVTAEMIIEDGERLKAEWLESQDEWRLDERFRAAKAGFVDLYAPVMEAVVAMQPGLAPLADTNRDRILDQIGYLENRAADALARRHDAGLKHWERMIVSLWPQGKPQERVLGAVHFLNRYGPDWLTLWREAEYDATGGHRMLAHCPSAVACDSI